MLSDERTVILDTETTGLDANARIVEISVITVHGDVLVDTLLDPDEPIPRDATGNRRVRGFPEASESEPAGHSPLLGR
ncbi:3'-5' exonuclease [Streptomyces sp. NPDC002851]